MLNAVGFKEYIYEDFAEEAFDLLCNLAAARSVESADVSLLSFFNDESRSIALIMYFKVSFLMIVPPQHVVAPAVAVSSKLTPNHRSF